MSGITDPAEEYFKNGLWGWVTDQWKKLVGDDAGHLQVDVVESGLPSGAATSANQVTMITALQLIDDLRAALNSVAGDELDVVIDGQTADVEVTQTAAADLTPGIMGWDGSAWRKLPVLWGYSDRWAWSVSQVSVGDGTTVVDAPAVDAGEVWIVTGMAVYHSDTTARLARTGLSFGGTTYYFHGWGSIAGSIWHGEPCNVTMKAGDVLRMVCSGLASDKTLYFRGVGYKMKVAE